MRTFKTVAVLLFIIVVLVGMHEGMHAFELVRRGLAIESFGIGSNLVPVTLFRFPLRVGTQTIPVSVHPLLIGAYVMPAPQTAEKMRMLPYRDQAEIAGAGVWINLTVALGLLGAIVLWKKGFGEFRQKRFCLVIVVFLAVAAGKLWFCAYVLPVAAILLTAYAIHALVWGDLLRNLMGPFGLFRYVVRNPPPVLKLAAGLSLSLAIMNMAALAPLDGGKVIGTLLRIYNPAWELKYELGSLPLFLATLLVVLYNDIARKDV